MIAVTGATGNLGQLVVKDLLKQGTPANRIVALVRDQAKAEKLLPAGLQVRVANYESVESLDKSFKGVEKVVLISGNEIGQRLPQHTNVVTAAKKAGVKLLAYTSILKADTSKMILAQEHLATEKVIQASGVPYVILRNSWYVENYTEHLQGYLASGAVAGSAQQGRVTVATRAEYASAAASAILGHAGTNKILELGGRSYTLQQIADTVAKVSGKKVACKDLPAADLTKLLVSVGLPEGFAHVLADSDLGIQRGDLFTESRELENLIGREVSSLESAVKAAL